MSHKIRALPFVIAAAAYCAVALPNWHAQEDVRRGAGVVAATLVMWISEVAPLGVVAMAVPIAATFTGLLTWREAVAAWGDPVVFTFLGAFLLARALDKHGAFAWIMSVKWMGDRGLGTGVGLAFGVLCVSGLLSTAQNNTAVAAMMLPVVVAISRKAKLPAVVLLALAWGSTFGGMATPVGTAPNFIGYAAMKKIDANVNFLMWLRVGMPVWIGTTLIGWGVLWLAARLPRISGITARRKDEIDESSWIDPMVVTDVGPYISTRRDSGDFSREARKYVAGGFALAVILWLLPGLAISYYGPDHAVAMWFQQYLPESLVPVAVALVLFFVRVGAERRPILDRHDFQALDWDTLFLIAGGLSLGKMLEASGAANALAAAVTGSKLHSGVLMFALAGATVLLSELTSNTATAALMVPIAGSLATALDVSPVQAIWLVALAASLGFALPVSTPPNALVYGTRLVPLRSMIVTGLMLDVLATIWLVCCVMWWA
jgi:sodium-dependent dicarboxylate transporter 2/3/5